MTSREVKRERASHSTARLGLRPYPMFLQPPSLERLIDIEVQGWERSITHLVAPPLLRNGRRAAIYDSTNGFWYPGKIIGRGNTFVLKWDDDDWGVIKLPIAQGNMWFQSPILVLTGEGAEMHSPGDDPSHEVHSPASIELHSTAVVSLTTDDPEARMDEDLFLSPQNSSG